MATESNQFRIKLFPNTSYNFTVKWGDGTTEIFNQTTSSNSSFAGLTHTYNPPGLYSITITENVVGGFPRVWYNAGAQKEIEANNDFKKIVGISQWGDNKWNSLSQSFDGCSNLRFVSSSFSNNPFTNTTNLCEAWNECTDLRTFDFTNTQSVTSFFSTWAVCSALSSFPVVNSNNVLIFEQAWFGCGNLKIFPLIDTSKGTNFTGTWTQCYSLTSFPFINTQNGEIFEGTWFGCESLKNFPSLNIAKGIDFGTCWAFCVSLTSFPLIDFAKSQTLFGTWTGNTNLKSFPLINTSSVKDFSYAWSGCPSLTSFPSINTSKGELFVGTWQQEEPNNWLASSTFPLLNFSKMTDGTLCFAGVTLPTQTYSSILTSLCSTNFNEEVIFDGGNSKYSLAGQTARNHLINVKRWTITDGGLSTT